MFFFLTLTLDPSHPAYRELLAAGVVREGGGRLLTVSGELGELAQTQASVRHMSASWNRLATTVRKFDRRVQFFRAQELQRNGRSHLHVVLRFDGDLASWVGSGLAVLIPRWAVTAGFGAVLSAAGERVDYRAWRDGRAAGELVGVDLERARNAQSVAHYASKVAGKLGAYATKAHAVMPKYARRASWSRDWSEWTPPTRIAGFTWRLAACSAELAADTLRDSGFRVRDPGAFRVTAAPAHGSPGSIVGGLA